MLSVDRIKPDLKVCPSPIYPCLTLREVESLSLIHCRPGSAPLRHQHRERHPLGRPCVRALHKAMACSRWLRSLLLMLLIPFVALCTGSNGAMPAAPPIASLEDLFKWSSHTIEHAAHLLGETTLETSSRIAQRLPSLTFSSCFSGIGGPEHAIGALASSLGVTAPQFKYAMEWDQDCRRELCCDRRHRPGCMFGDVTQFWDDSVNIAWTHDQFAKFIELGNTIKKHGWCLLHERYCEIQQTFCNIAGSPCPDWSCQGGRSGFSGSDICATMCWVGMRWAMEDTCFINENVGGFPAEIIMQILAEKYIIDSVLVSLEALGWPQRRTRRITTGTLKSKVVARLAWSPFISLCRRELLGSWQMFFCATEDEVASELKWSRARPGSLYQKDLAEACADDDDVKADPSLLGRLQWLKSRSVYTDSLTLWELLNIIKYIDQCGDPSIPFEVCQSAMSWPTVGNSACFPTLIKGMQMLFSCIHWRWATPFEVLLAQGFPTPVTPVSSEMLRALKLYSSFFASRNIFPRRRSMLFQQCGNSMNVHMIGCALAWAIACVAACESMCPAPPHRAPQAPSPQCPQLMETFAVDQTDQTPPDHSGQMRGAPVFSAPGAPSFFAMATASNSLGASSRPARKRALVHDEASEASEGAGLAGLVSRPLALGFFAQATSKRLRTGIA